MNDRPQAFYQRSALERMSMKPLLSLLVLLVLAGCQPPPRTALSVQEQLARDDEHSAIRAERAQQEYWENERGMR
jgi:uncharacterized lipoprotein YajG